ncbi:MAG: S1 RNA-binding domain-containing protein, partial [Ruoffia tabacinasalis]
INRAKEIIEQLTHEVKAGEIYEGTVKRIEKFGAFVEILPGKDGLVHISELEHHRVGKVEDVLAMNDKVKVRVQEIDDKGRINLSRKALIDKE